MQHRGHQSTDGADGGELTVPMAWFYAEYIADELLRHGDLMPPTSFEFRAGRDALALTVFLADTDGELSGIRVVTQLDTWLSLTAYDQPWQDWVRERMAQLTAQAARRGGPAPDLELAAAAWRWLEETELLAPDLNAVPGGPVAGGTGESGGIGGVDEAGDIGELGVTGVIGEEDGPKVWTPAWQLGLPLGHLAIHLF
ncbi:hypothetical protein [Streptomyces sp. JB150]|uniref:hypothetical protein n=1 Tax=Streptomyces sp. JB150 TaxID=2714844 RepID=UPI00140C93C8|nr:hypothetical protein [Streptomyces sp. JB150]QIJ65959.1 hypothetical protein G7Z13_31065 [Streptomyces sp. JB150]